MDVKLDLSNKNKMKAEHQTILNSKIKKHTKKKKIKKQIGATAAYPLKQGKFSKKKKTFTTKSIHSETLNEDSFKLPFKQRKKLQLKDKLNVALNNNQTVENIKKKKVTLSLRQRMMAKLHSARFRYLNEQIYSNDSRNAQNMFRTDPDAFKAYHEGYRQQVQKWPMNPLEVIIQSIQKMPKTHIIADLGCGEAKLSATVKQKVHSFDLVAANDKIIACDMSHVPLEAGSVDVVVFCLSLMGTNLKDYLSEANRILKKDGLLKIAEVESRFQDVKEFIDGLRRFNFKNISKDLSHNLFYFLDFKKEANIKNKKNLPEMYLSPCIYKKR